MKSLLVALAVLSLLELGIWAVAWELRKLFASLIIVILVVDTSALFVLHPRLWTGLLAVFGYYRAFNLSRLVKTRMHEKYLRHATQHASMVLMVCQAGTLIGLQIMLSLNVTMTSRWAVVAGAQFVLAIILAISTMRHVRTTRELVLTKSYADRDLPPLTVAIPARNETDDLEECLRSLVANDYPKLEVLVLDDCSSNAKTPEIIRAFAHDGVCFVAGSEPDETWLAKNWAYERLSEESNGELLLFCGVDTRFTPDGLRVLVANLLEKNKTMLSFLPRNAPSSIRALFVQPVRYGWELALPRRLFQRPAVLSTCWLVKKSLLTSAGGFKAVSRSIVPESYFARSAAVHDGYGFLRTNEITSTKTFADQRDTAVRTRYPQLHRRPELVALLSLAELVGLAGPFLLFVVAATQHIWLAAILSGLASMLLVLVSGAIVAITYRRFVAFSLVLLPLAVLFDVLLMHTSMYKYEFSEVIWKGRNVCIPVMHVVPHLPEVPPT